MKQFLFSIRKKDLELTWFSGTGAGGQYRNKHQNCLRLRHPASGAVATGQSNRDRISNQKEAIKNLTQTVKFQAWISLKLQESTLGCTLDEAIDKSLSPENLRIEIKDKKGNWTTDITKGEID